MSLIAHSSSGSRWKETQKVFEAIEDSWQHGHAAVLAMILRVKGSSYQRPGAKMMMDKAGKMVGTLSGGCLEGDLWQWSKEVMTSKTPKIVVYDLANDDPWGLGIGCKGVIDVLLLPIDANAFWQDILQVVHDRQPFALIYEKTRMNLSAVSNERVWGDFLPKDIVEQARALLQDPKVLSLSDPPCEYVIDPLGEDASLVICGAGYDAGCVAELADQVGFEITMIDPKSQWNTKDVGSLTRLVKRPRELMGQMKEKQFWLIMNHHQALDEEALHVALHSSPQFVGVLGPYDRTCEMLVHIGHVLSDGPLYAPVGLDLGAETPREVAVSIVSQLMIARSKSNGLPLSGRKKIHGGDDRPLSRRLEV
ncbi:XdhC family protein [Sulfobacillus thermosulfidooxidans]|uniref:XdhC family protein n=1 Tax=Sulfobacillus thermosulfidooxidans TaxID=28034 RepID=UPI0006B47257|nr:XdhC family protein [Sulfobacillus thermosulfidooxidans]